MEGTVRTYKLVDYDKDAAIFMDRVLGISGPGLNSERYVQLDRESPALTVYHVVEGATLVLEDHYVGQKGDFLVTIASQDTDLIDSVRLDLEEITKLEFEEER